MSIFLLIFLLVACYIAYSLVDEVVRHRKAELLRQGDEYAKMSDFGVKDHFLLRRFFSALSNATVVLVVFGLYFSILVIFLQSINSSTVVTSWSGVTFEWYAKMFTNRGLNNAILHTFVVSGLATVISTALGTIVAIGLYYSSKRIREHVMLLNNIPMLNADIVTGISLMLIFSFLVNIDPYVFGMRTMLIAHVYFCLPYVILNVMNKLKDLNQSVVDASFDLGLTPFKTLLTVIVPALKSGIFAGALLAFTLSYDDFVISYYTTGNGYNNLSIWIYSSIGRKSLSPIVYAFSCIVIIIVLVFVFGKMLLSNRKKKGDKK